MTIHLNEPATPQDDWRPAGDGEVVRLVRRLKGRKSRRRFLTVGAGVAGGLLAVAGGWLVVRPTTRDREYDYGGISCSEAAARTEAIMKGTGLSEPERTQLVEHVTRCPKCGPMFEKMGGMKMLGQARTVRSLHQRT